MTDIQEKVLVEAFGFGHKFWGDTDKSDVFTACSIVAAMIEVKLPQSVINAFINSLK